MDWLSKRLAAAKRLMLTGAQFDGSEALALGIADRVVGDAAALDAAEADVREHVLACAPGANAATKRLLAQLAPHETAAFIDEAARVFRERLQSDEGREGMTAFVEKRPPEWQA